MVNYIVASVLAVILGQAMRHIIRRIPEIIEKDNAKELFIATMKKGFKVDIICSLINLVLFNLIVYFVGANFTTYLYMFVIASLQVVFAIDYKMQLIPDTMQVVLTLIGIINVIYVGITTHSIINALYYIAAGIIGGGIFYLLGLLGKIMFKKEGMGFGDVKLMAALGLIFGIKEILTITLVSFFLSAIISILLILVRVKQMDSYIPFGPFIVIAAIAVMFTGYNLYVNLFVSICMALSNLITELMYKIIN